MKAATVNVSVCKVFAKISIHAAREGGDTVTSCSSPSYDISIHAAREGGDKAAGYAVTGFNRISIHAAREGGDPSLRPPFLCCSISIHAAREGGDCELYHQYLG